MTFALTDEQMEWRNVVSQFVERVSPFSEVARLMETEAGFDPATWRTMSAQLELQAVAIPEEFGGAGYTFREVAIALEEMGRVLLCAPYFSSVVLASSALMHSNDRAAQERYLPAIASGESIATVAFDGGWASEPVATSAVRDGDRFLLTGRKAYVIDGCIADLLLVTAHTEHGVGLFAVRGDAAGLVSERLSTMDQTRRLAALVMESAEAERIGAADATPVLQRVFETALAGLAAEQAGGIRGCLDLAVAYANDRFQFGRTIGSYQAVKHKLADMFVRSEQAASAATNAAIAVAGRAVDTGQSVALAKAYCSDAYTLVAAETVQIHGGIGTTWEHPAHLYLKRAKSSEILFGTAGYHRRKLAASLGISRQESAPSGGCDSQTHPLADPNDESESNEVSHVG